MIVKIVTKQDGVIFYDNLIEVRYKTLPFKDAEMLDANAKWLEEVLKDECCVWITSIRIKPLWGKTYDEGNIGLGYTIVASGRVYLCNDEGKTIERIN